jgi:protease I
LVYRQLVAELFLPAPFLSFSFLFDLKGVHIMDPKLNGLHIAILVTDGFEQIEFTEPKKALEQEGALVKVVSNKQGKVQGFHHDAKGDEFNVDLTFDEADPHDFDAIVLPGGVRNADQIRLIPGARRIVQDVQQNGKPIAVICHGAWLLVSAGLVRGRALTSWPTLQDDIRNAGGNWVDQEVVLDKNWVSSRKPADIPAFNQKMIEILASYKQGHIQGTPDEHAVGIASS